MNELLTKWLDFIVFFGVWLSLVECLVRDQEAGGSNPLTPTTKSLVNAKFTRLFLFLKIELTTPLTTYRKSLFYWGCLYGF